MTVSSKHDGLSVARAAASHIFATASAARDARRWTELELHRLGVESVELRDDIELVVTELLSNALQHGSAPFVVDPTRTAGAVLVSVTDTGGAPYLFGSRPWNPTACHGQGLGVLAALAVTWGIRAEHPGPGKTVWGRLRDVVGHELPVPVLPRTAASLRPPRVRSSGHEQTTTAWCGP